MLFARERADVEPQSESSDGPMDMTLDMSAKSGSRLTRPSTWSIPREAFRSSIERLRRGSIGGDGAEDSANGGLVERTTNASLARLSSYMPGRERTAKTASLQASPSGEVVVINKQLSERLGAIVPWTVRQPPLLVILFGLVLYILCALAFAAVFVSLGAECFEVVDYGKQHDEFGFVAMLCASPNVQSAFPY